MTVNIQTQYHDNDLMGYNTVAEIPGTDPKLKDEIVMLGGHLDSWHSSLVATDNGAGSGRCYGSRKDSFGNRIKATTHNPCSTLERRRTRSFRLSSLRQTTLW